VLTVSPNSSQQLNKASMFTSSDETATTLNPSKIEQVPTKLIKITAKEERKISQGSGLTSTQDSNFSTGSNRCKLCLQHCLYSSSTKFFRKFDKTMPTVWFTLFELKL